MDVELTVATPPTGSAPARLAGSIPDGTCHTSPKRFLYSSPSNPTIRALVPGA
jgi:hypothetical protein